MSLTVSGPGGTDTLTRTGYISVWAGIAHGSDTKLSYTFQSGKYAVTALVTMVNQSSQPVAGATVYALWTLPSSAQRAQQALTNPSGVATLRITSAQTGTYTIFVTNVSRTNWAYDPGQNVETCDMLAVP